MAIIRQEKFIDLQNKKAEEHYITVKQLKDNGFRWVYSTYGNPTFFKEGEGTVTILSGIIEQDGYFAFSD